MTTSRSESVSAFPLHWPAGWPRTRQEARQDSKYRFRRSGNFWTFAAARDALGDELDRLGARNVVLSTNYETRLDGLPRANQRTPDDTGVAIYFTLDGKQMVMACDMHLRAEENMRSLALAIEAMRQLERHGGGVMMERAFSGFQALPAPGAVRTWREVLGLPPGTRPTIDDIHVAWREKARKSHPDAGGSDAKMAELNGARDEALREIAQ